jgi:hypothetical protein
MPLVSVKAYALPSERLTVAIEMSTRGSKETCRSYELRQLDPMFVVTNVALL